MIIMGPGWYDYHGFWKSITLVAPDLFLVFDRQHVCDVICNVGYKNYCIITDYGIAK